MRYFLMAAILCSSIFLRAQDFYYETYNWDEGKNTIAELSAEDQAYPAVVVLDKRVFEYYKDIGDSYSMAVTKHKVVRVNDEKGVDYFNKVYIPMRDVFELVDVKARSIAPDGTVTQFDKENIKEVENMGEYGDFKIFAVEGVQKGADIEFIYTTKKSASLYGNEIFQYGFPSKEAQLTMIAPKNLKFKIKSYNDFPAVSEELEEGKRIWSAGEKNIPAIIEEVYSTEANEMKVAYKLESNSLSLSSIVDGLFTWEKAGRRYHEIIYTPETPPDVNKFYKQQKFNKLQGKELVSAIETYVKNNIAYKDEAGYEFSEVERILENKFANDVGLTRLYVALLDRADIKHETVLTLSRYEGYMDPDFADYSNLREILIFLPDYEVYLSPSNVEYRIGMAPSYYAEGNGLFITSNGNASVRKIDMPTKEQNNSIMEATISVDDDLEKVKISKKYTWTGYRSINTRAILKFLDAASKEQFLQQRLASGLDDAKISSIKIENDDIELSNGINDLSISSEMTSEAFLENAGNDYLLNVGLIIGTQSELYQEKERQSDMVMDFPIVYKHHIKVEIPKGYTAKGLEDAAIDRSLSIDGVRVCQFVSSYSQEGSTINIEIEEFYKNTVYPKEHYEGFREVINAASDFNKLVILLEKA